MKNKKNNIKKYHIFRIIVRFFIFIYLKFLYRFKVIGSENIPKNGPIIFCGKHKSLLDPPLMEITCKRDDTRFLAKKELAKSKFLSILAVFFHIIFVNKNSEDIEVVKESIKTLRNGNCIAIFPEGTRKGIEKGEKVKSGAAFFALNSNATVIPVGFKGGEKPFKKAYIIYGKPMNFDEYKKNRKDKETIDNVSNLIMNEILKLSN